MIDAPAAAEILTPGEAAAVIGISVTQLRRLRKEGAIPYTQAPGGHVRYRRAVIEGYAQSYARNPDATPETPSVAS